MSDDHWGTMPHMFQTVGPKLWTRLLGTPYEVLLDTDHHTNLRYGVREEQVDDETFVRIQFGVEGQNGSKATLTVRVPDPSETPLRVGRVMIRKAT